MTRRQIAGAVAFAVFVSTPPAHAASQIGVTSAVVPAARGTSTETEPRVLRVGLDMHANERIQTDAEGKAHLLFLDGSALSIGPSSEVVLDEYIFDPAARTGRISLSASRGLFRLVGGVISKTTPIELRTPTATVGIRGGIAMASVGETTSAAFLFGSEMTVTGSGGSQTADRPGFEITTNPDGTVNPPQPLSERMLARFSALEGGGPSGGGPNVTDADVAGSQVALFNSDAGLNEIDPAAGPPGPAGIPVLPLLNDAIEASQLQMTTAAAMTPAGGQDGVCQPGDGPACAGGSSAGTNGSPGSGAGSNGNSGDASADQIIGGGGSSGSSSFVGGGVTLGPSLPDLTLADVFVGRIKRSTDQATGTNDTLASDNIGLLGQPGVVSGVFDARATPTARFTIAAPDPLFPPLSTASAEPFGLSDLYGGGTITPDLKFLYYYLVDRVGGDRVFAFAGVPTPQAGVPDGGEVYAYSLNIDGVRLAILPFIDDVLTPSGGFFQPSQGYVVWANSPQNRAFGSGAVAIGGQGSSQVSAMSLLMGNVFDDGSGLPHLSGFALGDRRGQSSGLRTLFRSPLSSSDADDGSDFFGASADHFVLESSSVDPLDAILARGGEKVVNGVATPYFANVPATRGFAFASPRTTRTLTGFANALELDVDAAYNIVGAHHLGNASAADVSISTNNLTNGVFASFNLLDSNSGDDVLITFGGTQASGKSAFIDDGRFFAASQSVAIDGVPAGAGYLGLVTNSALKHEGFLPPGVTFCNCQYLNWGFFGGERFASPPAGPGLAHAELGTWVVGLPVGASQLVGIASQTATYSGHVIAGVMNGANIYQAAGAMTLSFTFGAGFYSFNSATISQFDGFSLTGANTAGPQFGGVEYTNVGQFAISGVKPGVGAVSAQVKGTFFGPGTPPQETGGNIVLSGQGYQGAGTYAARRP